MYYWVTRSYWSCPFLCTPGSRYTCNSRTSWAIPHSCCQLLSWATWNWRARPASHLTGIITCLSILFLQLACTIKQMQRSSIRYWEGGGEGGGAHDILFSSNSNSSVTSFWNLYIHSHAYACCYTFVKLWSKTYTYVWEPNLICENVSIQRCQLKIHTGQKEMLDIQNLDSAMVHLP